MTTIGNARPVRILMCDDDEAVSMLLKHALERTGAVFEFAMVEDGSQLLRHLSAAAAGDDLPDIVVLDLQMPGYDGHRTLEELAGYPALDDVPVVVFSSSTRPSDAVKSMLRGADRFETKPVDYAGMVTFASSLLEHARTTRLRTRPDPADIQSLRSLEHDLHSDIEDEFLVRGGDRDS